MQTLSIQDKCSLELLNKRSHALLSSPSPNERLWGKCDVMSDLKLDDNFHRKDEIMR